MSFPIKDLNLNLIKIRACEVGSQSQLAFLLLAAWWSQQTSDRSDKISLLIANVKVATLRLEFVNRDFKIQQHGRQRERQKKNNWFNKQNYNFARVSLFLNISFLFLHDYDLKMPNLAFYGGRKQATTKFYFSFWAWIWSLEIQLQEGSPTFDKVKREE